MSRYIALFRGINVGTAKPVPMPRLRQVFESIGYTEVQTVLRSGNVVFSAARTTTAKAAAKIEQAVEDECGVQSLVVVLTGKELATILADNPLGTVATNPSRLLITVLYDPKDAGRLDAPDPDSISPDALAIKGRAVYQWLPDGISRPHTPKDFWTPTKAAYTGRNLNTIEKLVEVSKG